LQATSQGAVAVARDFGNVLQQVMKHSEGDDTSSFQNAGFLVFLQTLFASRLSYVRGEFQQMNNRQKMSNNAAYGEVNISLIILPRS
jgi:uncharacterized membrane protein